MSSDIGWQSLELQVEALVPGSLILYEVGLAADPRFHVHAIVPAVALGSDLVQALLFVSAAYALGLVSSLVSRAIVDGISERGPRPLVFAALARHKLAGALAECEVDRKFSADLKQERLRRRWRTAANWNAVYRSALRRTNRPVEVERRRAQGRIVRNLLFPVMGAALVMLPTPWCWICALLLFPVAIFLYAYAEYVIFAEAYDIAGGGPH